MSHLPFKPRHLIVDRDGVLNVEAPDGGYVRNAAQWQWVPGSLEALALLARSGIRVSVATNQSGVGRGLMSNADLDAVHARMHREAGELGGRIASVHSCTHAPDDHCDCRKPAPGLLLAAVRESGIPPGETLVVGDDVRDIQAAANAGLSAVLVRTGKGHRAERALAADAPPVFDDLRELAIQLQLPGTES